MSIVASVIDLPPLAPAGAVAELGLARNLYGSCA